MDTTSYVVLSRQLGLFRQMDVISNNIANSNTDGFKSESLLFKEFLSATGDKGRKISFAQDSSTVTNTTQGVIEPTGRPLDAAIDGTGFFVVSTPIGERYTRVGRFHIDAERALVTAQGNPVTNKGSSIVFSQGDYDIKIREDGTITARVPSSVAEEVRGKLDIVKFTNEKALRKNANGLYSTTQPSEQAVVKTDYSIVGSSIEKSNVNATKELTNMIKVSRSVGSTSKFMSDMHEMYRRTITTLSKQN